MEIIRSLDMYQGNTVDILEMKDIGETRIVSFLANNYPAYIQFEKNEKGN